MTARLAALPSGAARRALSALVSRTASTACSPIRLYSESASTAQASRLPHCRRLSSTGSPDLGTASGLRAGGNIRRCLPRARFFLTFPGDCRPSLRPLALDIMRIV